jgi:hypothetical protein
MKGVKGNYKSEETSLNHFFQPAFAAFKDIAFRRVGDSFPNRERKAVDFKLNA